MADEALEDCGNSDLRQREVALSEAVRAFADQSGEDADSVVKAAEKFYKFLCGK